MRRLSALVLTIVLLLICAAGHPATGSEAADPHFYVRLCPAGDQVSAILEEQSVQDIRPLEGCIVARLTLEQMTAVHGDVTALQQQGEAWLVLESVPPQTYEQGLQPWEIPLPPELEEKALQPLVAPQIVAIIVEASIYDDLRTAIDTYVADVESRFPDVELLVRTSSAATAEALRTTLQQLHSDEGIQGAILVGSLPFARWEYPWGAPETSSLPLFYENLDDVFLDTDGDGYYDWHDWGSNEGVELWVSWIRPPVDDPVGGLQAFFAKTHAYHSGADTLPMRGLAAIGHDWWGMGYWIVSGLRELYGEEIDQLGGCETCYAELQPYLALYTGHDYGVQNILVHSGNWRHALDDAYLWPRDLATLARGPWFSVIWGCHAMDFIIDQVACTMHPDECEKIFASYYLMGPHNGRAALGVTRSVGTPEMKWLSQRLPRAPYLGHAVRQYLNLVTDRDYVNIQAPDHLHEFMWDIALVGDPFLSFDSVNKATVETAIAASSDDAEEASSGSVNLDDWELDLRGNGGEAQIVGLRFPDVEIPQDADITEARVLFAAGDTDDRPTTLTLHGQDADDAPSFSETKGDISSRPETGASVAWQDVAAWTVIHQTYQSPDLSAIVQEIVDRPGWTAGNALVIMLTGSGRRTAESYDGAVQHDEPDLAPRLQVAYMPPVDSTPPTGRIISPADGATIRSCPLTIQAEASDDLSGVRSVEFHAWYDNGWHHLGDDSSEPYRWDWDCSSVRNQGVLLTIHVWDWAGNEVMDPGGYVYITLDREPAYSLYLPTVLRDHPCCPSAQPQGGP